MSLKSTAHKKRRLNPIGAFTKFFIYATLVDKWVICREAGTIQCRRKAPFYGALSF